jgi:hypothetical protein
MRPGGAVNGFLVHDPFPLPFERRAMTAERRFPIFLIKPSHYDDDGYVIRWWRSIIPSNSLAALYGIAAECAERRGYGDNLLNPFSRMASNGVARVPPGLPKVSDKGLSKLSP